ncbi:MAG: winged helix-turn-helix transcriptional regulator [Anaerolineae bacterium]|nr:winged helix-turn-helix transcriptional regulator [Anaerolineae bacterium]
MAVTADIERILLARITSGRYPPGSRLPSVRELAEEFGANKNTVSRAFRSLAGKGYLRIEAGVGAFVAGIPLDGPGLEAARETLGEDLASTLRQARLLGLRMEEVASLFHRLMGTVYASDQVEVLFIECNDYDARTLGAKLEQGLGAPMKLVLLSDFVADTESLCSGADLAVTTFYHLAVVREAVAEAGVGTEVVGVHAPPETDALLRISRAPQGSRVLAVCTEKTTLNTIVHQVRAHNPSLQLSTHLVGDPQALERDLRSADLVVDTHTSHQAVVAAGCSAPIITLSFTIDPTSTDFLRGRVAEYVRRHVSEVVGSG